MDSDAELDRALSRTWRQSGASDVAVEEFVEGHEGFYDTISIDGRPAYDFISHYYPNVLEAMRERWISPQFISDQPCRHRARLPAGARAGQRAVDALGIGTSATHMEWFFGPKGLRFSEIGCRPPGVRAWDLYAAGNDIDIYREWANAIVHRAADRPLSRRQAAGIVALRPDRDGTISHYDGLESVQQQFGEWVLDTHISRDAARRRSRSRPATWRTPGSGWCIPITTRLRHMLNVVGETVHVHAS